MGNNPTSEVPESPTDSIPETRPNSPIPPSSTEITVEEKTLGEDMNKKDYRKYTSDPDLSQEVRRLSKSIGAVVAVSSLVDRPSGGFMIRTTEDFRTVAGHANIISKKKAIEVKGDEVYETVSNTAYRTNYDKVYNTESNAETREQKSWEAAHKEAQAAREKVKLEYFPQVPKNYKFANNLCLAPVNYHEDKSLGGLGTVFHLGNGIIASDGHVFFKNGLKGLCIVFDLSQEYFSAANPNEKRTIKIERDVSRNGKKQKIIEEIEILNEIPRENVFSLERIICGQEALPTQCKSSIDKLDWILLALKPYEGQKFPEALHTMPPQRLLQLGAGPSPIFTIGHTWGTSAKVSYPADEKYRILKFDCWDKTEKTFTKGTLENNLVHNLMIRVGNSGGPIFYHDKDGPLVIGTQGTLFNSSGRDTLTKFGFQCPSGYTNLTKPTYLSLTEPDSPFNWSTATKTSVWSYLLDTESRVNLLCVADMASNPGTMEFVLFLRISTSKTAACKIGSFQVGPNICNARKFSKPFNIISPAPGLTPTCIIGLGVIFTAGGQEAHAPVAPIVDKWVNQGFFSKFTEKPSSVENSSTQQTTQPPSAPLANVSRIKYLAFHIEGKNDPDRLSRIVLGRRSNFNVTGRIVFGAEGVLEDNPNTLPMIIPQDTDSGWFKLHPNWRDDVEKDEEQFKSLKIPVIDENTKT